MKNSLLDHLGKYSRSVALGIILFIFINFLGFYAWRVYSAHNVNPLSQHPTRENLSDLTHHELDLLFMETWNPGWQYQPWVGFTEVPRTGSLVTISEHGFRQTIGSSNLLENPEGTKDTLFFFGGSTTFGYNVADRHTTPSYFQKLSPEYDVFNFGRGYYYSKQENILLIDLLDRGHRPAVAVFIGDLNERCDGHPHQRELSNLFSLAQNRRGEKAMDWMVLTLSQLPLLRAIDELALRRQGNDPPDENCGVSSIEQMLAHRLKVRQSICEVFEIACFSFLQPLAGVHGRHEAYESLSQQNRDMLRDRYLRLSSIAAPNWFDISDSLDGLSNHAYVDNVHYSPAANERIARAVADVVSGQLEGAGESRRRRALSR
jgi:hypothetical protein